MGRIKYLIALIMVLHGSLLSCKTVTSSTVNRQVDKPQYLPVDKNWTDSLNRSTPDIKNALMKLYDNDINRFNKDFKLNLTQEEFNNLKTLSSETFRIDSVDFKNLNEKSSIRLMLKLVKTQAECYLLKDLDIILNMEQITEKGQWRISNVGCTFDEVGNKIEDLYFKENIKVHDVIVDDYRYGKKKFIVFVRNGEYINIKYGKEVPFIQRLLEFRKNLESGKIF
jgi:hypothetical protein